MKFLLSLAHRYIPRLAIGQNVSLDIYKVDATQLALTPLKKDLFSDIRRLSYSVDESFMWLPFGLSTLVRFMPFVGNYIVLCLNLLVLYKIYTLLREYPVQFQVKNLSQMATNVAIDFGLGLIPIVGFFTTVAVKCNTRNLNILLGSLATP